MKHGFIQNVLPTKSDVVIYLLSPNDTGGLDRQVIRISNYVKSFYCYRFPGIPANEFELELSVCNTNSNNYVNIERYTKEVYDTSVFRFAKRELWKISSTEYWHLKTTYDNLKARYIDLVDNMNVDALDPVDKSFLMNVDSPFRYSAFLEKGGFKQIVNMFEIETGIPLYGPVLINTTNLTLTNNGMVVLSYNNILRYINNNEFISKDDSVEIYSKIKCLVYDIETYNEGNNLPDIDRCSDEIIAIGVSLFNIVDMTPLRKWCLTWGEFDERMVPTKVNPETGDKIYNVYDEHIDEPIRADDGFVDVTKLNRTKTEHNDCTVYVVSVDEKRMLLNFILLLRDFQPQFIAGFNNFNFDDKFVFMRSNVNYGLGQYLLQVFDWVCLGNIKNKEEYGLNKFTSAHFGQQSKKIDNNMYTYSTFISNFTIAVDVRQMIIESDAKRFKQRNSLKYMLAYYNITNPYTNKDISKYDYDYLTMHNNRKANIHNYDMCRYCAQDALVTGVLLIKVSKLIDAISRAQLVECTIRDAEFSGVSNQVLCKVRSSNFNNNFMLQDTIIKDIRDNPNAVMKKFWDDRKIVGGMVKNFHPGKHTAVAALDYASMYPCQKEASNIDTSSRIPNNEMEYNIDRYLSSQNEGYGPFNFKVVNMWSEKDMYSMGLRNVTERRIFIIETPD